MGFEELKKRQSAVWSSAPYEHVADTILNMHDHLVSRLAPRPGERWLDVATGTGAIALRAARAGAEVTGLDLAPALLETARKRAGEEGLSIRFEVGDAERLPHEDASFDVVSSAIGAMFAPDHAAVARELARVCRPGGRLALTCWRPQGGVADMFAIMRPFMPPPPPGVGNQFDWGSENYVSSLLGDAFMLEFEEGNAPQLGASGEAIWELFSSSYGPTKTLAESLEPERGEELHRAFADYFEGHRVGDAISQPRPYLLVLGDRRAE